nr:hypothetical protein CFP56_03030 [Quercus suber]
MFGAGLAGGSVLSRDRCTYSMYMRCGKGREAKRLVLRGRRSLAARAREAVKRPSTLLCPLAVRDEHSARHETRVSKCDHDQPS